jgi:hypothetical protein
LEEVEKKRRRAGGEKEEEKEGREHRFAVLRFLLSPSLIYSFLLASLLLFISLFFYPCPNSIGRLSTPRFTDVS